MLAGASKPPVRHVSALTSLRFFAALGVVLFHYYPRSEDASGPVFNLMNHAYVGVSFFFVLSGFVLAYTTGTKDRYTRTEYLTFYARRIARVYPAFLLATLLHWPLFAWFQLATLPSPDDFLRIGGVSLLTFSLTQSYFPWSLGELNAPSWSVSVEMFLYAMFPWLLVRISGLRTNSRWFLLAACLCLCWIPCLLQLWLQSLAFIPWEWPLWISGPLPVLSTWISSFPLFHLAQFAVGVIAGVWTLERLKQQHRTRHSPV